MYKQILKTYLTFPLIALLAILILSCLNKDNGKAYLNTKKDHQRGLESPTIIDTQKIDNLLSKIKIQPDSSLTYDQMKKRVKHIRQSLSSEISNDSLSRLFQNILVEQVIPYWYNTPWSFEGHTAVPGQGEIACGYFVSTTLKDAGLNLNRYKLAQQNPLNEAQSLSLENTIKLIEHTSPEENIKTINFITKEGIYFIGFDQSHVGFILKLEKQLYLIHSNYLNAQGVMIEKIEDSKVFAGYERFYIAELSTNKALLQKWKVGEEIDVVVE